MSPRDSALLFELNLLILDVKKDPTIKMFDLIGFSLKKIRFDENQ